MSGQFGWTRRLRGRVGMAAAGMAALLLVGCGAVLGSGPAPTLYTLSPKSSFAPDLPEIGLAQQLVVEQPETAGGLNTNRIAVRPVPLQLDYYAGIRWSERAPLMVQTLLLESFENSGKIISVGRQALGLRPDYSLRGELREFQAQYFDRRGQATELPNVLVQLNVKLIQMPQERIVASRNFEACVAAPSIQVEDVIEAFDEALGGVMKDVVEWGLRRVEAQQPFSSLAQRNIDAMIPDRSECRPR